MRKNLAADDLNIGSAKNTLLPIFHLVGSYTPQGIGGSFYQRPFGSGNDVCRRADLNWRVRRMRSARCSASVFPLTAFGLTLRLPMKDRRAAADLADALVKKKIDALQVRHEQNVRLQVLNADQPGGEQQGQRQTGANRAGLRAKARGSRQKRYELGTTNIFFVLAAQKRCERSISAGDAVDELSPQPGEPAAADRRAAGRAGHRATTIGGLTACGELFHGPHPHPLRQGRQQDRRRRGGGAARLRRQGASGELARRRLDRDSRRGGIGRTPADPHRRQRLRHAARRCDARVRAACDQQAERRQGSALDRDARFRGEALPSIASVSRLLLETRAGEEETGTRVEIAGGKLLQCDEAALPPGTVITVRDLFYNVPARKKFLRSDQTELAHIASLVTHYSLAHPEKTFQLHNGAKELLHVTPVRTCASACTRYSAARTLDELVDLGMQRARDCRRGRTRDRRRSRAACSCCAVSCPGRRCRS